MGCGGGQLTCRVIVGTESPSVSLCQAGCGETPYAKLVTQMQPGLQRSCTMHARYCHKILVVEHTESEIP